MKFLKWLLGFVVVLIVSVSAFLFYMRYHDGPIEIISGGPFQSGEVLNTSDLKVVQFTDLDTLQLQTLEPPRSRTTWLVVVNERMYIPSGYMNTGFGKIWKQWPKYAEKDGRALIRIGDKIYKRQLVRIDHTHPDLEEIFTELDRKYSTGLGDAAAIESGSLWLFELAPR